MNIDVSAIIERQKLSRFLVSLIVVSWLITFFDGFDTNLISFAAPYLASEYHLDRIQLGNIFSIGLVGTLIGGLLLGYALSAFILLAMLPESIRFLASKGQRPDRIRVIVGRIAPDEPVAAGATFVVGDEDTGSKDFKPSLLFRGELRFITPMIWTAYVASSFAVFFIVNWTPLVFEALHYTRVEAASVSSLNSLMGAFGGVLLMRFTDKRGAIAITIMPFITALLLLFAGFVDIGHASFLVLNVLISGFLIGGHFGMISICGLFYPSAYRANGAGWATSIAKIGSIAGPITGGFVLSTSLPVRNIFGVLAICPAIFAVCIYFVGRIHRRMLDRETLVAENIAMPSVLYSSRKAQR